MVSRFHALFVLALAVLLCGCQTPGQTAKIAALVQEVEQLEQDRVQLRHSHKDFREEDQLKDKIEELQSEIPGLDQLLSSWRPPAVN